MDPSFWEEEESSSLLISQCTSCHGGPKKERQSDGWTINKLRFSNVGVYGRQKEIQQMKDCLERMCKGPEDAASENNTSASSTKSELILLSGYSGAGKSILASTLEQPVKKLGGIFAKGKFDLELRDQPYAGVIQACGDICKAIAKLETSNSPTYKGIKDKLIERFDSQSDEGRSLCRVLPGLPQLLGMKSDSSEGISLGEGIDCAANVNRWQHAINDFFRIVASESGPLVVVLDDLQWANSGSLKLLEFLLNNKTQRHAVMIVGCYRFNEIGATHILSISLRDLRALSDREEPAFHLTDIFLGNLDLPDVNRILMDLLAVDDESATLDLAKICHRRTDGNAYFFVAFVSMLKEQDLLEYNFGLMKWRWNESTIEAKTAASKNVVDIIKAKITNQLGNQVRRILAMAACLGTTFEERLISVLWDELISEESRLLINKSPLQLLEDAVGQSFLERHKESKSYRWVHDKVQEAVMSLVRPEKQEYLKFEAGKALYCRLSQVELEASLFIVCNLLNAGSIPEDRSQRRIIAKLNLLAAKKATQFSAFNLAEKFTSRGIEALPKDECWQRYPKLCLDLYSTAVEVEKTLGHVDEMERHSRVVLDQKEGLSLTDKLRVYIAIIEAMGAGDRVSEAKDLCFDILGQLGCRFPSSSMGLIVVIRDLLRAQKAAKKLDEMFGTKGLSATDKYMAHEVRLLGQAANLCFKTGSKTKLALVTLRSLKRTREQGIFEHSALDFAAIGLMMVHGLSDFQAGAEYARFSLQLIERFKLKNFEARCLFIVNTMVAPWSQPIASCLKPLVRCYEVGLQVGDTEYAVLGGISYCITGFQTGKPLHIIVKDLVAFRDQAVGLKQKLAAFHASVLLKLILNLMGESDSIIFDEELTEFYDILERDGSDRSRMGTVFSDAVKIIRNVYFAEYDADLCLELKSREHALTTMPNVFAAMNVVYRGILLATASRLTASSNKKYQYKREAARLCKTIKLWIRKGNPNLVHHESLMEAEMALLHGHTEKAKESFQKAVIQASRVGIIHEAALANERFGVFLLRDLQDEHEASFRINDAIRLYSEWGARLKVDSLRETYADCLVAF